MSQTVDATPRALREAFYVLSTAQDVPDAKLLDDVVRRYPHFSEELTEFAIAIAVDALGGERAVETAEAAIDPGAVSPAVSRAMSHFQNRLHGLTTAAGAAHGAPALSKGVDAPNPFVSLPRNEFRALAERLNVNGVFVGKLRDRQIDPGTMTFGFQKRVADELRVPLNLVAAHFAAEPVASARQFYKAEGKPSASARQTFEEAVRNSGLSEAQQRSLLDL
jgi:hypothetical protein